MCCDLSAQKYCNVVELAGVALMLKWEQRDKYAANSDW